MWGYGSRSVSVEEMYDICQRHSDLIKAVSPQVNFSGKASGTLKIGTTSYRWSNMRGVDENFTEMKNYQIVQGRGLQYMDMQDNKQVCVIGDYLNRVAFGGNGVGADAQDRCQQVPRRRCAVCQSQRPHYAAGQR